VCGLVRKGRIFFQKVIKTKVISRPFRYIELIMKCPSYNGRANLRGHYKILKICWEMFMLMFEVLYFMV
jgi:hypothetical protein